MTEPSEAAHARHAQGLPPIREPDAETAPATREIPTNMPADPPDDDSAPLEGVVLDRRDAPRPAILPAWMRSWGEAAARTRTAADDVAYVIAVHAVNSPIYLWRCIRWTPAGIWRTVRALWRWLFDADLVAQASAEPDADATIKLWAEADKHRRHRLPWLAAPPVAGLAVWLYMRIAEVTVAVPWWAMTLTGLLFVIVMGPIGRPPDRPIGVRVVLHQPYTRITAEQVREALCRIGLAGLKEPEALTFPEEIHRDGPGQMARVNLPPGVLAADVVERRRKLSSALRVTLDQVWPDVGADHEGQLDLWVARIPVSKMRPPAWAVADDNAVTSAFEPIPFAYDARLRPLAAPLFQRSWLIGGVPGSGKSYAARAIVLGASLDRHAELKICELKGTGDFGDLEPLCSEYYCGLDDEAREGGAGMFDWGLSECERRGRRIRQAKRDGLAPEGKVTPKLAAAGIGLHPVILVVDEAHELLDDKDVAEACERLMRLGRALNLSVILATQIPDADAIPKNITRCAVMRWCLAVPDQPTNDMILGTGAYKAGRNATAYRPEIDAGWGVITGLAAPTAGRSYKPADGGKSILERAMMLRGGRPVTSEDDGVRVDVLVDVLNFWPAGQAGAHWTDLAQRLAEKRPDVYAEETRETLSARLRAVGVDSVVVAVAQQRERGCRREAVEAALEKRAVTAGGGS